MDNKKVGVAVAVVVAVAAAYGGATWYLGQRAQAGYQDAVAELRKALGDDAVVSADYDQGFFSSKARLVMQWAGAPAQEGRPASPPLRLVVDTVVRHGPLAGARVAAAVADYRFALEGLDDEALAHLDKASAPVLTSVHHLTGSHDVHLRLPAGEAEGGDGVALRWQEMVSDFAIGRDGRRLQGRFRWPEFNITGLPDSAAQAAAEDEEENDADETASAETASAEPVDRTSITVGAWRAPSTTSRSTDSGASAPARATCVSHGWRRASSPRKAATPALCWTSEMPRGSISSTRPTARLA
ncbi:YdgA family protein [Paracidovorax avenae]|uniref:YdgA family protein n=1 Tax=Paracidovorax avenae TaxID=80867 RepID=UPI0021F26755|nr:YdgA family protein [Paracidovorax avenae]